LTTNSLQSFVAAIAAKYGSQLRRFLTVRSRNAADVPYLAQEVFLRLMRVEHHEDIRNPEAYLFTVASHVLHQHSLRQSTAPVSIDITEVLVELQLISEDDPTLSAETRQRVEDLQRTLAQLPAKVATTLLLHRYAGFSLEEIEDLLQLQDGTDRRTIRKIAAKRLEQTRARIADLKRMEKALAQVLHECEGQSGRPHCPIIEAMTGGGLYL